MFSSLQKIERLVNNESEQICSGDRDKSTCDCVGRSSESEVQNNITINWELLVDLFIETRLCKFLIFFVFLASGIFPDKSRSVGN